jgi:hypothetical protein
MRISPLDLKSGKYLYNKVEPAPKSRNRRIATKSPKHQPSQNIVYQYIKISAFVAWWQKNQFSEWTQGWISG